MFTSINRDDFDHGDSILSCNPFSSETKQHHVHHQHSHYQFSQFNIPSPYPFQCFSDDFDYPERAGLDLDLDLILFHHQQLQLQQQQKQQQQQASMDFPCSKDQNETRAAFSAVPGMRSSKKDWHSKITTARGPRDRRMRLSLKVAREFFDLQDMLGFDKASKTVEWLISQSKSAIREIIRKVKGSGGGGSGIVASYDSDCKISHNRNSDDEGGDRTVECSAGQKQSNIARKARQSRKSNSHRWSSSATRESRRKARERARERTLKKIWKRRLENSRLNPRKTCSSPLETGEESCCVQTGTTGSNLKILTEYEEIATGQISVEVSSDLICSKQSPEMSSSNLNLQAIGIPPFNQLKDCEQFLKQWDTFYNYGYNRS